MLDRGRPVDHRFQPAEIDQHVGAVPRRRRLVQRSAQEADGALGRATPGGHQRRGP
jgi:hypothetical protein